MRKIILYMATSIDGFVAQADGSVDWLLEDADLGDDEFSTNSFLKRVDTICMGRVSYEQTLSFGPWAFERHKTYVFSQNNQKVRSPSTEIVNPDLPDFVQPTILGSGIGLFGNNQAKIKNFKRKALKELGDGFSLLWYEREG